MSAPSPDYPRPSGRVYRKDFDPRSHRPSSSSPAPRSQQTHLQPHVWKNELALHVYELIDYHKFASRSLGTLEPYTGYDFFTERTFNAKKQMLENEVSRAYSDIVHTLLNEGLGKLIVENDPAATIANVIKDLPPKSNLRVKRYIDARGRE